MSSELDHMLFEYYWKFGDDFPTEGSSGTEKGMIEEIDKCLKSGKPYDPYEGIPPEKRKYIVF